MAKAEGSTEERTTEVLLHLYLDCQTSGVLATTSELQLPIISTDSGQNPSSQGAG